MAFYKKIFYSPKAFSVVEIVISVTILSVLATIGVVNLVSYSRSKAFESDALAVAEAMRFAQSKARLGEGGTDWGIKFTSAAESGTYEVFSGSSYSTSTIVSTNQLSRFSIFTNPSSGSTKTILFSAITGLPSTGNQITIGKKYYDGELYTVSISALGKITQNEETDLVAMWGLDEATGTTANDASGSGSTGTLTNFSFSGNSNWVSLGKIGASLKFDGNDDFVDVASPQNLNGNDITVSFWLKTTTVSTWKTLVARKMSTKGWSMLINSNSAISLRLDTTSGSDLKTNTTSPALNDGNWHFIAATINQSATEQKIYVDGTRIATSTSAGTFGGETGGSFALMKSLFTGAYTFGELDEVRVYDRILSASEIQAMYEQQ